jgi:hypothetical protein
MLIGGYKMKLNDYLSKLNEEVEFTTSGMLDKLWRELTRQAMDKFNIHFDLENYDSKYNVQEYVVEQDEWEHTKCKFRYQMCSGGGDWENPVISFRCQLVSGYAYEVSTYDKTNGMFVYIPSWEDGNKTLVLRKNGKGWVASDNDTEAKGMKNDEIECVKSLKKYLKSLVTIEVERIRKEREYNEQRRKNEDI